MAGRLVVPVHVGSLVWLIAAHGLTYTPIPLAATLGRLSTVPLPVKLKRLALHSTVRVVHRTVYVR